MHQEDQQHWDEHKTLQLSVTENKSVENDIVLLEQTTATGTETTYKPFVIKQKVLHSLCYSTSSMTSIYPTAIVLNSLLCISTP